MFEAFIGAFFGAMIGIVGGVYFIVKSVNKAIKTTRATVGLVEIYENDRQG